MVKQTNTNRLKQKAPNLLLNQFFIFLLVVNIHPAMIGDLQSSENSQKNPRILVIHSYHHDFTWSDNISSGIRSVLEKHDDRIEFLYEFMDTRQIYSDEYFQELKRFFKTKYAGRKIDVIICSDDHSFNFMTGLGQEVFNHTPIVFCSVSGYKPEIRIGRQITGILESIDIRATLDIALKLHPKTKEVAVISDMTPTGRALKSKAEKIFDEYRPRIQFRYLENLTVEKLQQQVSSLSKETIVFLLIFSRDKIGRVFSHEEKLKHLMKYGKVPIYAVWDFYLGNGIIGGKLTSVKAEGKMAGEMALRIIRGEKASDISLEESPTQYMFDYQQLHRFNVEESSLPESSILINKPFSFYQTYKQFIWGVIFTVTILLIIVFILVISIVQRKKTEVMLAQSEKKYRLFAENVSDVIWTVDMNLNMTYVSPSVERARGYTVEEAMAQKPEERLTPESLEVFAQAFLEELELESKKDRNLQRFRMIELEFFHKNGSKRWNEVKFSPIQDADGETIGFLGVSRDITERKLAEEMLLQEKNFTEAIINSLPGTFYVYNENYQLIRWNKNHESITGYSAEELYLKTQKEFFDSKYEEDIKQFNKKVMDEGEATAESDVIGRDGTKAVYYFSATRLIQGNKKYHIGVGIDITAQKRAEKEKKALEKTLQQAHKMEAIGTLAGGIAHDFNNILSAIIGYTELLQMDVAKENRISGHLEQILKAGNRAKDLIQQILTFSRQTERELKPVMIKIIVKEALKLLRATLPTTIHIEHEIKSDSLVMGDPTQVHQIIMNLCSNAGHAMQEKGGILRVELADVELDPNFVSRHPDLKPGTYLNLTVGDTGHGMTPDVMARIFDPFFTTKEKGRGTGMGLAVSHGIVKSFGGTIYAYSEPGKGSIFKIFLPVISSGQKQDKKIETVIPLGTERILFIDDEPALVDMGKQTLESLGYQVVTRTSSLEALNLFRTQPDRFDLVITDMTMPQMAGDKLAIELITIRKDIPIILCTGFSYGMTEEKARQMGIKGFLMKPFLVRDIANTVRNVLDEKMLQS